MLNNTIKKDKKNFIYIDEDVKKSFDELKDIVSEQLGFKLSNNKLVAYLIKNYLKEV